MYLLILHLIPCFRALLGHAIFSYFFYKYTYTKAQLRTTYAFVKGRACRHKMAHVPHKPQTYKRI